MSIPKIFFTYWEGNKLSFLHYYTIYSLHKLNPTQEIIIYTSETESTTFISWNSHEHSIEINNFINFNDILNINKEKIILKKINFSKIYNLNNNLSVIYKADFIRIAKLYEHGGMWFDFDILFIKPIPDYLFLNKDFYYFSYEDTIPTGLLLSKPNTLYLNILFKKALHILQNFNVTSYQTIGPDIWIDNIYKDPLFLNKSECLDNILVYAYNPINYNLLYDSTNDLFNEKSFACHWYNGGIHTKNFINKFNNYHEDKLDKNRSIIEKYLIKIIDHNINPKIIVIFIYKNNLKQLIDNTNELSKSIYSNFEIIIIYNNDNDIILLNKIINNSLVTIINDDLYNVIKKYNVNNNKICLQYENYIHDLYKLDIFIYINDLKIKDNYNIFAIGEIYEEISEIENNINEKIYHI